MFTIPTVGQSDISLQRPTTTNTTIAKHGRCQQTCPPSAPHEALCSAPMQWMDGRQPPEEADIIFEGVEDVYSPQTLRCCGNASSPEQRSASRAIHTLSIPFSADASHIIVYESSHHIQVLCWRDHSTPSSCLLELGQNDWGGVIWCCATQSGISCQEDLITNLPSCRRQIKTWCGWRVAGGGQWAGGGRQRTRADGSVVVTWWLTVENTPRAGWGNVVARVADDQTRVSGGNFVQAVGCKWHNKSWWQFYLCVGGEWTRAGSGDVSEQAADDAMRAGGGDVITRAADYVRKVWWTRWHSAAQMAMVAAAVSMPLALLDKEGTMAVQR